MYRLETVRRRYLARIHKRRENLVGFLVNQFILFGMFYLLGKLSVLSVQAQTNCAVQTQILEVECEALLALYNNTNGANWERR